MQSDLAGRVRNTSLPTRSALLPLFEAVINSVHAIEERGIDDGLIEIHVDRAGSLFEQQNAEVAVYADILGFSVTDNGAGFTERNYASFDTLDSLLKEPIGGKGVGRLLWLVAFEHASVESRYVENGGPKHRRFSFRRTSSGVEGMTIEPLSAESVTPSTTVRLVSFRERYREAAPKTPRAIARRIVEHCLVLYMLDRMPRVLLHDPTLDHPLDLSTIYRDEVRKTSSSRPFEVGGESFEITDVILRRTGEAEPGIHYCANKRVVKTQKLSGTVPHGDTAFSLGGEEVLYAACVTGDFLDRHVDAQRTDFAIDHEGMLAPHGGSITWEQITRAAASAVSAFLAPYMQSAREKSLARIRDFVETKEPRYRILLGNRRGELEQIPGNLSDEKLEVELHRLLTDWRHTAKSEAQKRLQAVPDDAASFARFKESVTKALGELQEVSKADLADYVVHRRTVLDYFQKLLGLMENGKFAKEDALHGLFFPLKRTSDAVDYEDHNLWVIDERLAYHHFLASDLAFSSQVGAPVVVDNDKRPDLIIYDRKLAYTAEDLRPFTGVVIVEFKKPERNDYTPEENPVAQVYDYIRDLRQGKAKARDGASLDQVGEHVPFFCHVIVSLTTRMRAQLDNFDFTQAHDGQSYFLYNKNLKAYIEVSSYARVLQDAVKRNKAFFDKLGLHTGVRQA